MGFYENRIDESRSAILSDSWKVLFCLQLGDVCFKYNSLKKKTFK